MPSGDFFTYKVQWNVEVCNQCSLFLTDLSPPLKERMRKIKRWGGRERMGQEKGREVHRERMWEERERMCILSSKVSTLSVCINQAFFFSAFWCSDIWGLANSGGIAPLRVSQFLETVNKSPARASFTCTGHYSPPPPVLTTPGPGSRQPSPQSP